MGPSFLTGTQLSDVLLFDWGPRCRSLLYDWGPRCGSLLSIRDPGVGP